MPFRRKLVLDDNSRSSQKIQQWVKMAYFPGRPRRRNSSQVSDRLDQAGEATQLKDERRGQFKGLSSI